MCHPEFPTFVHNVNLSRGLSFPLVTSYCLRHGHKHRDGVRQLPWAFYGSASSPPDRDSSKGVCWPSFGGASPCLASGLLKAFLRRVTDSLVAVSNIELYLAHRTIVGSNHTHS